MKRCKSLEAVYIIGFNKKNYVNIEKAMLFKRI